MRASTFLASLSLLTLTNAAKTKIKATTTTSSSIQYANTPVPTASSACPTSLHAIAISGAGSPDVGGYGKLITLVNNVTAIIPGSTQVSLTYPKSAVGASHIDQGAENLINYLHQYTSVCTNTKIAILSYSSGAMIAMNAVCGAYSPFTFPTIGLAPNASLKNPFERNIVAVTAYGDETYSNQETFTIGNCTGTGGQGEIPRTNPSACENWAFKTRSYCVASDPRCCGGSDPNAHFVYPQLYDHIASQFVFRRWNKSASAA